MIKIDKSIDIHLFHMLIRDRDITLTPDNMNSSCCTMEVVPTNA